MKTRSIVLALALCVVGVAASFGENANMGTWKLNEAKSKIPAGAIKNTTVVYAAEGDSIKVTTDGKDRGVPGWQEPNRDHFCDRIGGKESDEHRSLRQAVVGIRPALYIPPFGFEVGYLARVTASPAGTPKSVGHVLVAFESTAKIPSSSYA
jgi:hypothetical protein